MKVLIVDDSTTTRTIFTANLRRWGYESLAAADARSAMQKIAAEKPDIVMVDWMMPGISGIELCRWIRAEEGYAGTYIIMVTARAEEADMVAGLESGADDYISKSSIKDIFRCRLAIAARTIEYKKTLERQNKELMNYSTKMEKLVEERTRQLIHTERIATAGMLSAGIAHEINNPMTFISGNLQTLERIWVDLNPALNQLPRDLAQLAHVDFIQKNMPDILNDMRKGVQRVTAIVNGLKAFCRQGDSRMVRCDVKHCIEQAIMLCNNSLKYHVRVECNFEHEMPAVMADAQQLEQVLVNLIINAADAMSDRKDGLLDIKTIVQDESIKIMIADNGPGIPQEHLSSIWQPFFTTKPVGKGTGLGLPISMGIIERFGGSITAGNHPGGGALFTITLPLMMEGVSV